MNKTADLTSAAEWDEYWRQAIDKLPIEITRERASDHLSGILDVLDEWIFEGSSVLEIGGAPGQFIAYVARNRRCRGAVLDYSPHGCAITRENLTLLDVPIDVYEGDMFATDLPRSFDVVYSLGVVEHFDSLTEAVAAHSALVRPGGRLLIGMPNLIGINGWFARRINPARCAKHNGESMRLSTWTRFESDLRLRRLFRSYVGGFEPNVFTKHDDPLNWRSPSIRLVGELIRLIAEVLPTKQLNSPAFSGYMMGVWEVPHT